MTSGLSLDDTRRCPGQTERVGDGMCQAFQGETPVGRAVKMVFDPGEATQRVIVLLVAACLMGTAIAIRELVGERPIFRREYAVGLSPGIYFFSKVLVLGSAAFVQGLLVTFIAVVASVPESMQQSPIGRSDLARGSATSAPEAIASSRPLNKPNAMISTGLDSGATRDTRSSTARKLSAWPSIGSGAVFESIG